MKPTLIGIKIVKLLDSNQAELMAVNKLERDGQDLLIKGKIYGSMPMTARLTPDEARSMLKLLDWRTTAFLVSLLFRKSKAKKEA
ncbi:hypothetical protein L288_19050 [Sphingobium quisquiliarum P25]|uniref:Uncharacterized protein n=1 Tax=Sphingobium quisquiliarum P25 TaxID=1329909 RepID=T0HKF2_9SPHN|nr:hypothetical protein [Sphingobium quisquiliarum]EQA99784.1 hypothetical protein L288_19050 [Sphingobium quisquiliarum P25]